MPVAQTAQTIAMWRQRPQGGVLMGNPRWVDRPGSVGSQQERDYYEQAGGRLPDTIGQIKAILRSSLDAPLQIHLFGRTGDDGAPALTTEMLNRAEVANAVSRLPLLEQREGLRLVYEQGVRREDAAAKLGISVRSLDRYLAEALELLADYVCEYVRERSKAKR